MSTHTQPVKGMTVAVLDGAEARSVRDSVRTSSTSGWVLVGRTVVGGVRRLLDLLVAASVLLVLSPLLIAIALAVRIDSKGPVLFRQRRVGRGQREFTIFKFRTMCRDADASRHRKYVQTLIDGSRESERGHLYKLSVDDRVTRVGRFLRSWSLDELPQLINVLLGQMALVGPRPVIAYEVEMYPDSYLKRFAVKPGLTGLWQVSGRNERTYDEMVSFDIEYAESSSLWLDVRILAKTVPVVLRRQGVA
jgi:lipopolysaccharide/colanic/teichoic acid biosynthesis glycosyltransferase